MGGLVAFALRQTWGSSRAAWCQEYVLFHILLFALGLRWWEEIPQQSALSGFAESKSFSAWTSLSRRGGKEKKFLYLLFVIQTFAVYLERSIKKKKKSEPKHLSVP